MLKKSEMIIILNYAVNNKPHHFYGDYIHGLTGYWSAVNGYDLELNITHTVRGAMFSAVLYEKFTDLNGKPNLIDHKRYCGSPNKHALKALTDWLPTNCMGIYR